MNTMISYRGHRIGNPHTKPSDSDSGCFKSYLSALIHGIGTKLFLMFIIYMNDLVIYSKLAKQVYADDTVCYMGGTNIHHINDLMKSTACKVSYWCQLNRHTVNQSKSELVLFSMCNFKRSKDLKKYVSIKLNGTMLEVVPEYRYLGIL